VLARVEIFLIFGSQKKRAFVGDVFKACPVPPIVVISIEGKCKGDVLEAVLVMCKSLSYNREGGKGARFVVDLTCSWAAIDASIQLSDLRAVGVPVGPLSQSEALLYATDRMPKSLKDLLCRDEIARTVVETFDGPVLTLQQVCKVFRKGNLTTETMLNDRIMEERNREERKALNGWMLFCSSLVKGLGRPANAGLKEAAILLMEGPQPINKIITVLSKENDTVMLTSKHIGLCNANAGYMYHPLAIDPFEPTTVSLSGKAMKSVLEGMYTRPK
jgi:hypothetical protein